MSVGLQISHGIQSTMASLLRQILATRPKALSSSKASFSTPIAKAEYEDSRPVENKVEEI